MIFVICSLTAGEISNFVLGISSFITAIVTAIVLCKQYRLQKKSSLIGKRTKQPVFNVSFYSIDEDDDNKYENEILQIQNDGNIVKQINDIKVITIYDVSENSNHKLFWIIGYFWRSTCYQNLNGLIYKSRGNSNSAQFMRVYYDAVALYKNDHRFVKISVAHLIKIEYIDIYGEKNICCFKGRSIINEEEYNTIYNQICNQHNPIDINKVTLDELLAEFSSANQC